MIWLWGSLTGAAPADVDRWCQAFPRRFDLEHTFRLLEQTLGWTRPGLRTPDAADRWTWLIIAAHAQLRMDDPVFVAPFVRFFDRRLGPHPARLGPPPLRGIVARPVGPRAMGDICVGEAN